MKLQFNATKISQILPELMTLITSVLQATKAMSRGDNPTPAPRDAVTPSKFFVMVFAI